MSHHSRRQNELGPVALNAQEGLRVAEKLSKVNVEQVTCLLNHDVVVVTVTQAQQVCDDAVASTRI